MSKQINIQKNIMSQIQKGKIVMRPKIYFLIGSILSFLGLIASAVLSIFFICFIKFVLRTHGPMGSYRFLALVTSFPWWALLLVILGFSTGVWFLRKYDFSYKKNFWIIVAGFISALIIAGWILDATGLDNIWFRQGPMRGIYKIKQGNGWKLKR